MSCTYKVSIAIDDKKSDASQIRGVATADGIDIPFTVYRVWQRYGTIPANGYFDSTGAWNRLGVRSKGDILSKYKEGPFIRNLIKDKARGWWIDHNQWR